MPENTVPTNSCPFEWCTSDHTAYGWEDMDQAGTPGRFHEHAPDVDPRLRAHMPYLVVEEKRTESGIEYSAPYVSFDEKEDKGLPVEDALAILHASLAAAGRWRYIAAELAAPANGSAR